MKSFTLPSPAKINLFLHINGRLPNGYHELQTLFQFLDFHDRISFTQNENETLTLSCNNSELETSDNLISKAYDMIRPFHAKKYLHKRTDIPSTGIHIHLEKSLPLGGGVGGGSSNAATTLLALNTLWNLKLPTDTLLSLALSLGADVPIFIRGHAAFADGVGEQFTNATPTEHVYLLLIPEVHVNTATLFQHADLKRDTPKLNLSTYQFCTTQNDFEPLVKKQYPKVARAINALIEYAPARLTGTGACLFAPFDSLELAQQAQQALATDFKGVICQGLNQSPTITALKTMESTIQTNNQP